MEWPYKRRGGHQRNRSNIPLPWAGPSRGQAMPGCVSEPSRHLEHETSQITQLITAYEIMIDSLPAYMSSLPSAFSSFLYFFFTDKRSISRVNIIFATSLTFIYLSSHFYCVYFYDILNLHSSICPHKFNILSMLIIFKSFTVWYAFLFPLLFQV